MADRRDLLAAAAEWLAPPPLTVSLDGPAWTLEASGATLGVRAGTAEGAEVVHLATEDVVALAADQVTPMAWFSNGTLRLEGRFSHLLDWWLLMRGALDGVAPTLPGAVRFADGDGSPLDLHRSFTLDDEPGDLRQFLEEAGYLHLRGVFSEAEMAAVSRDMDAAAGHFSPGDGQSWWATTADGTNGWCGCSGSTSTPTRWRHSSETSALTRWPGSPETATGGWNPMPTG